MLLFGCNPLCIVNTFLVLLLSSCNSSLVQSRNAAEYLSKDISQLLIFYIILSTQFFFEKFFYSIFIFLANFLFRFLLLDLICLLFVCTYTHHFQSFNDFISFPSGCFTSLTSLSSVRLLHIIFNTKFHSYMLDEYS